jgi:hypothetical protein
VCAGKKCAFVTDFIEMFSIAEVVTELTELL